MIKKPIFVIFVSPKIEKEFESLKEGKFESKKLFDYITRAIEDLRINSASGVKIPRDLWPDEYIKNYKITNLWKYDLPNAWRLIYTIQTEEIRVFNIILEWFNHKDYEKRFGY